MVRAWVLVDDERETFRLVNVKGEPFSLGELKIDPVQQSVGDPIDLFWRGRSIERHPAQTLVPYVSGIIESAAQENATVRLHFETLDHMNSSTITAIIQIIRDARAKKTRLEIIFD